MAASGKLSCVLRRFSWPPDCTATRKRRQFNVQTRTRSDRWLAAPNRLRSGAARSGRPSAPAAGYQNSDSFGPADQPLTLSGCLATVFLHLQSGSIHRAAAENNRSWPGGQFGMRPSSMKLRSATLVRDNNVSFLQDWHANLRINLPENGRGGLRVTRPAKGGAAIPALSTSPPLRDRLAPSWRVDNSASVRLEYAARRLWKHTFNGPVTWPAIPDP